MAKDSLPLVVGDARRARGLSISALAKALSVAPSTVLRIERGDHNPSPELLLRIARALSVDLDALFVSAGKLPPDVAQYLLTAPGALGQVRAAMPRTAA